MTDEEKLAEEYVKSVIDVNAFDWKIVREIYLAFLEGLKADRPEWHDLRKDPNDLPKDNKREYLVSLDWLGKKYELLRLCEIKTYINAVIAWCEIPTFDKE